MKKKVKHIIGSLFLVIGIFLLASSCMEGLLDTPLDDEISLTHTYAMPLVEGTYTLDKVPIPIDTIWNYLDSLLPGIIPPTIDSALNYTIEIRDTMDSNLGSGFDGINESTLYFTYINGFPFDCDFRAILYDSVNMVNLDTMINLMIPGSEVINGVTQMEEGLDSVIMGDDFYSNMEQSNQIVVEAIYTAYLNLLNDSLELQNLNFEFQIGLKAEVTLK